MVSAGFRVALVALVLLAATSVSFAQVSEIKGTVQRVDVPTGTIYFTDGRIMKLEPGSKIHVGNREMRLADVEPGWILITSGPTVAPGSVVVQTATAAPTLTTPATTGVDATGVVASVDARTGMVTLQDGRVIRVTPGTTVWQPVTIGSVMPGASVFVRNAEPLDFRPGTAAPVGSRPYQMGTIGTINSSSSQIVLSDGTVVRLRPGTQVTLNGQSMAMTDLRPGDEIIVGLPATAAVSTGTGVSALPRQALGVIDAERIYVVRRPQSP
jgi:hypothetical protein